MSTCSKFYDFCRNSCGAGPAVCNEPERLSSTFNRVAAIALDSKNARQTSRRHPPALTGFPLDVFRDHAKKISFTSAAAPRGAV